MSRHVAVGGLIVFGTTISLFAKIGEGARERARAPRTRGDGQRDGVWWFLLPSASLSLFALNARTDGVARTDTRTSEAASPASTRGGPLLARVLRASPKFARRAYWRRR